MRVLGLDVGGANIKAADGRGWAASWPFALWRHPDELPARLSAILTKSGPCDAVALTMTGELADCFRTKAEGVLAIVQATQAAAAGRAVWVYQTDGQFHPPHAVTTWRAAASNWHALAAYACRWLAGPGLLVDMGSTTTDIIPIAPEGVRASGQTDPERLLSGELVYTGVVRSPVAAICRRLPYRGQHCPTAQELFATAWDAYVTLGWIDEDPDATETADGRPATRQYARERLARMICADATRFSEADAQAVAAAVCDAQILLVAEGFRRVGATMRPTATTAILSGEGQFLIERVLAHVGFDGAIVRLDERLGPGPSQAAPAHAVAALWLERSASERA